jgi:hypothetical protein
VTDPENHHRELDRQFLAKLKTATLSELIQLESHPLCQSRWKQAAIGRAIWRAMLR